jgi:catechol 2,3-dioxygenase-like lactoylglutathione lyase family enzyme
VPDELVNLRYMVNDVEEATAFYTTHVGFTLRSNFAPAFADVVRGNLRLLLSGPTSSAGRPMPDGRTPEPGDVRRNMGLNARYQFVLLYTVGWELIAAAAADINQAVEDGAFRVGEQAGLPLHRFSLEDTPAAHAAVESGVVGKVLITVGSG